MEQTKDKLEAHIKSLEKALGTLQEALGEPLNDFMRDTVIKRFEYVFELSWKTIQIAATFVGSSCKSPREAIRVAWKLTWIKDADVWFKALEARNNSSHTYNLVLANEVYETAKSFPALVNELLGQIKQV